MKFFIESVTVSTKFAKTNKGYATSKVFEPLQRMVLTDGKALQGLTANIERLVETCNRKYRGKPLCLAHAQWEGGGQIVLFTGEATQLASIVYRVITAVYDYADLRQYVADSVRTYAPDIYEDFKVRKGGEA